LPIRVHDFLLACAGRIDDDALTDARELLAMAELDRAVELITGSLVAGRIRLSADERDELLDLVDAVRSSPALVDRVIVDDNTPLPRHRFTTGGMDDPAPETGVLEAVGRVIEVLPDIRSLSCVWRITPAGAPAGPVPQRLVLVETGPDGFAPSTAYRVEQALRRAGIRAAVEVVQAGTELSDYHGDAIAMARRLSLRNTRPREKATETESSSLFADPPSPRPVTTTRRRASTGAHAEKRSGGDHSQARWQPRIGPTEEVSAADPEPDPVPQRARHDEAPVAEPEPQLAPAAFESAPFEPAPFESTPFEDGVRPIHPEPVLAEPQHAEPAAVSMPVDPEQVASPVAAADPGADPDADLSNRERELLRQLHEELAKREQTDPPEQWQTDGRPPEHRQQDNRQGSGYRPPVNPPGQEFNPANFRQQEFNPSEFGGPGWQHQIDPNAADQTAVNGIPPYGSTSS
jgi:hypothetical protein